MESIVLLDTAAYIDAGTGSYLLAAIASGAAGLWMFFRSGMARFRRKLGLGSKNDLAMEQEEDVTQDAIEDVIESEDDPAEESSARG